MAKTLAQQIAAVEEAIERAEQYQATAAADGRSITNANLKVLYDRLDALKRRATREAHGSVRGVSV